MPTPPPRRALVTGATSHVGGPLVRRLVRAGFSVRALVRPNSDLSRLDTQREAIAISVWNGTAASLERAVGESRPTDVFHLAVAGGSAHSSHEVDDLIEANLRLGTLLLEALMAYEPARFVNVASYWQHGADGRANPASLHAALKEAFASVLAWYQGAGHVHAATVVLYSIYGPRAPRHKLLPQLLAALRAGTPVDMSPGEQGLDFVHEEDAGEVLLHVADLLRSRRGDIEGQRFCARSGRIVSPRELVHLLERLAGRPILARWCELPYPHGQVMAPWPGPLPPGWTPRITLEEGLKQLLQESDS